MAGSIALSLSQQFDQNGRLLSGGRLYFYQANTTTPQNAFKDTGLTLPHPNPIVLDSKGRVPAFYLADGAIRVRLTDRDGVVQIDEPSLLVVGPSSGAGGGGPAIDPSTVLQTGDIVFNAIAGTRSGWVRANGRTIGSATSGGSERANSDCQALFSYLWQNLPDAICPVPGGRGASAAADWAANKQITLPDMRGRAPFGLDDMGNEAANRLAGAVFSAGQGGTTAAGSGGEAAHTLAVAEMPAHAHANTLNDPGHRHGAERANGTVQNAPTISGAGNVSAVNPFTDVATTGITLTNASAGGGQAHNNMPPFLLGTWFIKL
jgi:microcystin-dependent protein